MSTALVCGFLGWRTARACLTLSARKENCSCLLVVKCEEGCQERRPYNRQSLHRSLHSTSNTHFQCTVLVFHALHKWAGGGQTMELQEMGVDRQVSTGPGHNRQGCTEPLTQQETTPIGTSIVSPCILLFSSRLRVIWQLRPMWSKFSHGRDNFQKLILPQAPSLTCFR